MVWPGKIRPGTLIRDPATTLDFFPTFCELAGLDSNDIALDGSSLGPLLLEGNPLPERNLFWQQPNAAALRRGPWKYLRVGREEMLFNLEADAAEAKNLAEQQPDLLRDLKSAHATIASALPKH